MTTSTKHDAERAEQAAQRSRYLNHEITFDEYYLWLAEFIGVTALMVPVSIERIRESTDPHLNDITLATWDRQDYVVRGLAGRRGLAWSLSDTVCVLKAVARKAAAE